MTTIPMVPADAEVAELLLFVLAVGAGAPTTRVSGYQLVPEPEVLSREETLRILADYPAPANCGATFADGILSITCRTITDEDEVRVLRKHADFLLASERHWRVIQDERKDAPRVLLGSGKEYVVSTLTAWRTLLHNYRVPFSMSSAEGIPHLIARAREVGAAFVIRIFPPGEMQLTPM